MMDGAGIKEINQEGIEEKKRRGNEGRKGWRVENEGKKAIDGEAEKRKEWEEGIEDEELQEREDVGNKDYRKVLK